MNSAKLALGLAVLSMSGCEYISGFTDRIGVGRAYNYAVLHHVSAGGDGGSFEENTPGLGIGSEAPIRGATNYAVGLEAGIYRNPKGDNSGYALTYAERDLLPDNPRRLRAGLFAAVVDMPSEADYADISRGDVLLTGGLQMTFSTVDAHEFRLRIAPGFNGDTASFLLSSNIKF